MSRKHLISGAAALVGVIAIASTAVPTVRAATTVTIRPSDLITAMSDTRTAGHVTFRTDGIHVKTDDTTGQAKAAEYFALTGPIPTSASLDWIGTDARPGQQIAFDVDGIGGNGNDWNILVGEPVYGANWWLTNSSSKLAKDADPSGANDGGNGSTYFGTLAEWAAALPDARVYAGGFSLGSGVKGDGVIDQMTYDGTTYRFTSTPADVKTIANVDGTATTTLRTHGVRIDLRSEAQPAHTVLGAKLDWKVKVDRHVKARITQGFGDHDVVRQHFTTGSGRHVVKVIKNGVMVQRTVVRF